MIYFKQETTIYHYLADARFYLSQRTVFETYQRNLVQKFSQNIFKHGFVFNRRSFVTMFSTTKPKMTMQH